MTTLTKTWRQPAPTRNGLAELVPPDPRLWEARISQDRIRAAKNQSATLRSVTREIENRGCETEAHALVLTGSTARNKRTRVSDLDYYVVGGKPNIEGLRSDIDLYGDAPDAFLAKLFKGDDFVHWALRYGCILFDDGVLRNAVGAAIEHDLWPDPARKLRQARRSVQFAQKLVPTGDYAALLEISRGAFSLTARWLLLSHDVFPLARDELPEQLQEIDQPELGRALEDSIHRRPSTATLGSWLDDAARLVTV